MLRTLKDLFDSFTAPPGRASAADSSHSSRLAAAVLLLEVMRADPVVEASERAAVVASLCARFALEDDELARLLELAESQGQQAYDYHRFTSSLNDHFSHPEKVNMVEAMWQVAYADAHLDAHENHLISKIAGLLHVTHGEYIAAKLRARDAAGSSPPTPAAA